jgi:RNA polymerase sigma-70 factor (family 1)
LKLAEVISGKMDLNGLERLLVRISEGDEQAFSSLFNIYKDKIYSVTLRLTGSTAQAEDTVQDIFLKVWLKRENLANISDFENYLVVMARNEVYSAFRSAMRKQQLSNVLVYETPISDNSTFNSIVEKEYAQVLLEAINRLPVQQRQVYLLSKEEDMKREEIAKVLQISSETVKTHLSRALRRIRAYSMARLDIQLSWLCVFFLK